MPRDGAIAMKADRIEGFGSTTDKLGFFGTAPVSRPSAYSFTNVAELRTGDMNTVTTAQLADIVGTLIADLQAFGLLQ